MLSQVALMEGFPTVWQLQNESLGRFSCRITERVETFH
jgi:hypothetical protein